MPPRGEWHFPFCKTLHCYEQDLSLSFFLSPTIIFFLKSNCNWEIRVYSGLFVFSSKWAERKHLYTSHGTHMKKMSNCWQCAFRLCTQKKGLLKWLQFFVIFLPCCGSIQSRSTSRRSAQEPYTAGGERVCWEVTPRTAARYLQGKKNSQLAWNGAEVTKAIISSTQSLPKYRWREGGEELETHP